MIELGFTETSRLRCLLLVLLGVCCLQGPQLSAQGPQQVYASDKNYYGDFGNATAIAGDYAAIGATRANNWPGGAVYIFQRQPDGTWLETQKIAAPPESYGNYFGIEVDMDGEYMATTNRDGDQVFIYKRNTSGIYEKQTVLEPSVPSNDEGFGHVIKLQGNYVLIGAPFMDVDDGAGNVLTNAGAAYIFERDSAGNWTQLIQMTAETPAAHSWYGIALTASENEIFITANRAVGYKSGVFRYTASNFQNPQYQEIMLPMSNANDGFGRSVSYHSGKLLVGEPFHYYDENGTYVHATGAAHLFTKAADGTWSYSQRIQSPYLDSGDYFGMKVELSAGYAAIGSENDDDDASGNAYVENAGSVHLYAFNASGQLELQQKVVAPQRQYRSHFSSDIALQGSELLVGSYAFSSDVPGAGTAYFFTDFTAPSGYAFASTPDVDDTNASSYTFSFSGAEVGSVYDYTITHAGSGEQVQGSSTVTSNTQEVLGIDLSELPDGDLTISLRLTDPSGNQGPLETAAILKSTTPFGYLLTSLTNPVTSSNVAAAEFSLANAELGTTCDYIFYDGAGNAVSGSVPVDASEFTVSGVDLTTLNDGEITFTVNLTDAEGNIGALISSTVQKDTQAPQGYSIGSEYTAVNQNSVGEFQFQWNAAEIGTTWHYEIASNGGTELLTGSGTVITANETSAVLDLSSLAEGELTLSFWLVDPYGQEGERVTLNLIKDTTPPLARCQPVTLALDEQGQVTVAPAMFDNGSEDVSGITDFQMNIETSRDCTAIGTEEVQFTVVDAYGNVASCTTTLTVVDDLAPVLQLVELEITLDAQGSAQLDVNQLIAAAADNCSSVSLQADRTTFGCEDLGPQTVTVSALDEHGNETTATTLVQVSDSTPPEVLTKQLTVFLDASGTATILPEDVDAGTYDNCGIASLQLSRDSFSCDDLGFQEIEFIALDNSGNEQVAVAVVEVKDEIAPQLQVQPLTLELNENGQAVLTSDMMVTEALDNCGIATMEVSQTTFDCSDLGTKSIEVIATDHAGNHSVKTAEITIQDTTAPEVRVRDLTVYLDANGEARISPDMVDAGSTDNCGIHNSYLDVEAFYCGDEGQQTVFLLVADNSGNVVEQPVQVTVINDYEDVDSDGIPDNCDPEITSEIDTEEEEPIDVEELVQVAEAFSPNGDGINDTWNIINVEEYPGAIVTVYNRWGNIVFQVKGYRNDWDGSFKGNSKLLPESSTYYYQIDLDADGSIDVDGWLFIAD